MARLTRRHGVRHAARMPRHVVALVILLAGLGAGLRCAPARATPPDQVLRLPTATDHPPPRAHVVVRAAPRVAVHRVGPAPRDPPRRAPPPRDRHPVLPLPPDPPRLAPPVIAAPHAALHSPGAPAHPATPAPRADRGSVTGLPLPRFAALRSDEVYLRAGPGFRYPVRWVYRRIGMPVEIEREFEVWRLVLTPDGVRGWMHEATLKGKRDGIVTGGRHRLRAGPTASAAAVAILEPGVIVRLMRCDAGAAWCRVDAAGHRGWLGRADFWGTFPGEAVTGR